MTLAAKTAQNLVVEDLVGDVRRDIYASHFGNHRSSQVV